MLPSAMAYWARTTSTVTPASTKTLKVSFWPGASETYFSNSASRKGVWGNNCTVCKATMMTRPSFVLIGAAVVLVFSSPAEEVEEELAWRRSVNVTSIQVLPAGGTRKLRWTWPEEKE